MEQLVDCGANNSRPAVSKNLMYFVPAERMRTTQHSDGPRTPNRAVRVVSLLANPYSPLSVATASCG